MVLIFVFWNISFKVCNNACIMPRFGKNNFHRFLISVFKMNDTVNFEDNFLYIFSGYQTRILHSKSVILIVLCLVLTKKFTFKKKLLGGFRVNYSVNIENYFSYTFSCYLRYP